MQNVLLASLKWDWFWMKGELAKVGIPGEEEEEERDDTKAWN